MKRLLVPLVLLMLLHSCSEDLLTPLSETPETTAVIDATILNAIKSEGFDSEGAIYLDETYVLVEDDIMLPIDYLATQGQNEKAKPNLEKQYRTNRIVDATEIIYVDFNSLNLPAVWVNNVRNAVDELNRLNTQIRFVFDGNYAGRGDLTIKSDNGSLPARAIAGATWPVNSLTTGGPGNTILINSDFSNCTSTPVSDAQALHNLIHEIGHCVGFRHTNLLALGETATSLGANHIPGTPTGNDVGSVMNGGTACDSWNGFSNADRTAFQTVYPILCSSTSPRANWLTGPTGSGYVEQESTIPIRWNRNALSSSTIRIELIYTRSNRRYQFVTLSTYGLIPGYDNPELGIPLSRLASNNGSLDWPVPNIVHDGAYFKIRISDPQNYCSFAITPGDGFKIHRR